MAIYSGMGVKLKILAEHGWHDVKGYAAPVHLVSCKRAGAKDPVYKFTFCLRADKGAVEVEAAADGASKVSLEAGALKRALEEAM